MIRAGEPYDSLGFDMFIEKDCSFSALISDRVGCSGGLILNPSWVQ